jgi:hypothetical protein
LNVRHLHMPSMEAMRHVCAFPARTSDGLSSRAPYAFGPRWVHHRFHPGFISAHSLSTTSWHACRQLGQCAVRWPSYRTLTVPRIRNAQPPGAVLGVHPARVAATGLRRVMTTGLHHAEHNPAKPAERGPLQPTTRDRSMWLEEDPGNPKPLCRTGDRFSPSYSLAWLLLPCPGDHTIDL